MENTEPASGATQPRLLLWVAAVALLIYLVTLNRWLSLGSLFVVAEVNGWNWPPTFSPPVLYLCLLPFKCLPAIWVPRALNLASAGLASLVLLVLARSVALLTSASTKKYQRLPSPVGGFAHARTWLPPVFAAVVLGLGLTFWEHATVGSGEILDVLLLACAIWCLLEYRVDRGLSWLYRAALVTGLGVANSWAFLAFVPVFVVATLRLRKLRILRLRDSEKRNFLAALAKDLAFFARLALWGIAGASIVLVVPIAQSLSPDATVGFWQALLAIPRSCKSSLLLLRGQFWFHPQGLQLLIALVATTLLPALLFCIRWPDFADKKLAGLLSLEAIGLYAAHAFLFLTSLVVVFDPPFGPRQAGQTLGLPISMLGLYYLAALSVGYYSDFFLAAFPDLDVPGRVIYSAVRRACPKLVVALLGMVAVGLFARNAPLVRALNGPQLTRFARSMVDSLPPEGAVVFSGDAPRLLLLRAALENEGKSSRFALVSSSAFGLSAYRAWLQRQHPMSWLDALPQSSGTLPGSGAQTSSGQLSLVDQTRFIAGLASSNRVSYLEWAVGPLLELVYLEPSGLAYQLRPNSPNRFSPPPPAPEQMAANEALWSRVIETEAKPIVPLLKQAANPELGGRNDSGNGRDLECPRRA